MKFIKMEGQPPVNLERVEIFRECSPTQIQFIFSDHNITWDFETEQERDAAFEKIMQLINIEEI